MITITKQQLTDMQPCDLSERLALFGADDSLSAQQAFARGASVADILWIMGRLGLKEQIVAFAEWCAARAAADAANAAANAAARVATYAADAADAADATDAASVAYATYVAADAAYAAADAAYTAADESVAAQKAKLVELLSC
jgi:hypothetical protein